MDRLEEIKEIHDRANEAYSRFESSSACADQDMVTDILNTLFYEEHTDWLIQTVEEQRQLIESLKYKNEHLSNDLVFYKNKSKSLDRENEKISRNSSRYNKISQDFANENFRLRQAIQKALDKCIWNNKETITILEEALEGDAT
ncbi:hypothetical protein GCM10011391_28290 [Pullulanibacillus camelliae]|uniref:Uncharacterized protein n=1 Tax=Pullulanibacillus camelliae TaxID=1707096 RepID=A0A8J2YJZ1_9BACL|nr:hypothetical protein [Pullulanibacillus camelliae]GGE47868.1 hypothetical protein GCM10011391_28290 [Pullulanibacillus camelliae]